MSIVTGGKEILKVVLACISAPWSDYEDSEPASKQRHAGLQPGNMLRDEYANSNEA